MKNHDKELKEAFNELLKLKESPVAMHIAIATSEYPTLDNISNKEFVYLINKYLSCRELEIQSQRLEFDEFIDDGSEDQEEWL